MKKENTNAALKTASGEKQNLYQEKANEAFEQKEIKQVLHFLRKYVGPITVVCVLLITGYIVVRNIKIGKTLRADAALAAVGSAADYQTILDRYENTPSAPLALLGLAQRQFNAGETAEAERLYTEFLRKYEGHTAAVQAKFGQIACREALGQIDEANELYGKFEKKYPKSYLAPAALLGKARCLELTGHFAEAKRVYEDVMVFHPGSSWSKIAEARERAAEIKLNKSGSIQENTLTH